MLDVVVEFAAGLANPATLVGHFTYFLLILSMLMRRMIWLRTLAIASGLVKIAYRTLLVFDPVTVFWETVFVLVNVGQLLILWYYERHHTFAADDRSFAESLPEGTSRRAIKRALKLSRPGTVEAGATLTERGRPVGDLIFLTSGVVQIETGERIVAACGAGDYLGEMSFLTGRPATATARAVKPARFLAFDQSRLRAAMLNDAELRRLFETGLNRNLVGKLARASDEEGG